MYHLASQECKLERSFSHVLPNGVMSPMNRPAIFFSTLLNGWMKLPGRTPSSFTGTSLDFARTHVILINERPIWLEDYLLLV